MKHQVRWTEAAENFLAAMWFDRSSDQSAIMAAARKLCDGLSVLGTLLGESRSGARRIAFEPPLGIHFHGIDSAIEVFHVWYYR